MPFRVWTGATWVFGSPGTWGGFWEMVFDNRGGRVFTLSTDLAEWSARVGVTLEILSDDMLWLLLILGLTGLLLLIREGKWREGLGMTLAWVPNFLLSIVIWRGRVIDAQLAAKLPVIVLAGVGLAVLLERTRRWSRPIGIATVIVLALTLVVWGWQVRPFVLSITRDPSAQDVIDMAEQLFPLPEDRLTSLVVLWGHDYWALACRRRGGRRGWGGGSICLRQHQGSWSWTPSRPSMLPMCLCRLASTWGMVYAFGTPGWPGRARINCE
jgi:hypothetical protein